MIKEYKVLVVFLSAMFFFITTDIHANVLQEHTNPLFYIIIPSYNNAHWYRKNLDSVLSQDYENYHVIYIDDLSPDGTGDLVDEYIKQKGVAHKVTLHVSNLRRGALANLYFAIHESPDNAIIVTLDGDDWFAHEGVLSRLAQEYRNPDIWLTYGQYTHPWGGIGCPRPISQDVIDTNAYRNGPLLASHLRTFYAWLFKSIAMEDLLFEGPFFPMTWDWAMMFPMLEMSGGRFKYIEDILYVYNTNNPINDNKVDEPFQILLCALIQQKVPYDPVEKPIDISSHISRPVSCAHVNISDVMLYNQDLYLLFEKEKNKGTNYLVLTDGIISKEIQEELISHFKRLEQTHARLGVVATIMQHRITRNNITKDHFTPLYDNAYTFQCGWMPKVRITNIQAVIISLERFKDEYRLLSQLETTDDVLDVFRDYYPEYAGLLFITKEI